jgi:Family of unknown function (DUF5996)
MPLLGPHGAAEWQDTGSGSLAVPPYDHVRTATDPAATLLDFYQSACQAGAAAANWDTASFDTGRR